MNLSQAPDITEDMEHPWTGLSEADLVEGLNLEEALNPCKSDRPIPEPDDYLDPLDPRDYL